MKNNDYRDRLFDFFEAFSITSKMIEDAVGASRHSFSQWKAGRSKPSDLIGIAGIVGIDPSLLKSYLETGVPLLDSLSIELKITELSSSQVHFGRRIRFFREQNNLTMGELATDINSSQPTISDWERGNTKDIKAEYLLKISKRLGISPFWLLYGEGHPFNIESHVKFPSEPEIKLTDEEQFLVSKFQSCSKRHRQIVLKLIMMPYKKINVAVNALDSLLTVLK